MTGSTWFCHCGEPDCSVQIDIERVVEGHCTYIAFESSDDESGRRGCMFVPVVFLAEMFDLPEQDQYIEWQDDLGYFGLDCYGGEMEINTELGYTSLPIDEEFIKMLRKEVFDE